MSTPIFAYDGTVRWYIFDRALSGQLHREDGPAIEHSDGSKGWYLNDCLYTFKQFVVKAGWSDEDVVMYKLSN